MGGPKRDGRTGTGEGKVSRVIPSRVSRIESGGKIIEDPLRVR